jgi:hypothetical protein
MRVLCSISTKGRYENYLPLAIMSVIQQTRKPDHLTIYDDNDAPQDLRQNQAYRYLFHLLDLKGIKWDVVFGQKKGQHHNHQTANKAGYDAVWRLDDDCVAEPDVLEKLLSKLVAGVGAVGGSILNPSHAVTDAPANASSMIWELSQPNKQWFKIQKTHEVDHLHCSFLYRAGIVNYDLRLSKKAHREETMFTFAMKMKGYRILVTPCVTWHLQSQTGGIRSDADTQDFHHDEYIFREWLTFVRSRKQMYVLNNGLGDHYMFRQAINPDPRSIIACCYPEVFHERKVISIADAKQIVDIDAYDVYRWCGEHNWKGTLIEAFREMYKTL